MPTFPSSPPLPKSKRVTREAPLVNSFEETPVMRNSSPSKGNRGFVDDDSDFSHTQTEVISSVRQHLDHLPDSRNATPKRATTGPSATSLSSKKQTVASSAATRRLLRNRAKERSRDRVAGGAAAKLIGPATPPRDEVEPEEKFVETEVTKDDAAFDFNLQAIDQVRARAREEWKTGTEDNKRYMPSPPDLEDGDSMMINEEDLPIALNRKEVFHESANDAVVALLTPTSRRAGGSCGSDIVSAASPDKSKELVLTPRSSSFRESFSDDIGSPSGSITSGGNLSAGKSSVVVKSAFTTSRVRAPSPVVTRGAVPVLDTTYGSRPPSVRPFLNERTEQKIEILKDKMLDPSKTLADLLTAICSPPEGQKMDRGYMVRRKNACGALKVLTAKKENRRTICWTVGVLKALTSVLEDCGDGIEATFPDAATRFEYVEARKRAVTNLLNLVVPKENRCAVFHSAGLVKALVKTIGEDDGESRQGCCAILAYLARTVDNRVMMVHVPELIDTITNVIDPDGGEKTLAEIRSFLSSGSGSLETFASEGSDYEDKHDSSTWTYESATDGDTTTGTENVDTSFEETKDASEDSIEMPNPSPHSAPVRTSRLYDKNPNEYLEGARQYIFAVLSHLVKDKENQFHLVRNERLLAALVAVSKLQRSVFHKHAVMILANLTRHRDNSKCMVFRHRTMVPAFVYAMYSANDETRKYACYGLQNLSQEKACRQEIACTNNVLPALCKRALSAVEEDEKLAAIDTLKNLTDEPANLVPMTNAPECLSTFMQIAHGQGEGITEMMQYRACDGLTTLSHWLRKIATSGQVVEEAETRNPSKSRELFVPSLKVVTWNQWD